MVTQTAKEGQTGCLGKIIAQLLGWLVCIVVPGVVTAIAPVSWIKFQRQGDHVTARADICFFFVIPYRTLTVDPVTSVGNRTKSGSINRYRRSGKADEYIRAESEGFLQIQGPHHEIEVPVTPADIESVVKKAGAFLQDPQAAELKLFVVANWKFSILFGGLASLMTVLYLGGVIAALGLFLLRKLGLAGKAKRLNEVNNP
jgi:hypothetical protein